MPAARWMAGTSPGLLKAYVETVDERVAAHPCLPPAGA